MSVQDKVNSGAYTSRLAYPSTPVKPKLGPKATSVEARAYADALEQYERELADVRESRDAYNEDQRQLDEQFRRDLEEEFGMKNHPKASLLFAKAWDMGHSAGYGNVLVYYSDLHELVA